MGGRGNFFSRAVQIIQTKIMILLMAAVNMKRKPLSRPQILKVQMSVIAGEGRVRENSGISNSLPWIF